MREVTKEEAQQKQSAISVDMLVFTVGEEENSNYRKLPEKVIRLLMTRNTNKEEWSLPGGFVGFNEDLESSAKQKLKQVTSIDDMYLEQLYTWGDVHRMPYNKAISVSYMSLVNSDNLQQVSKDCNETEWFTVSFKLKQEQKDITENGYKNQSIFELVLQGSSVRLTAILKTNKTVEGNITSYSREIIESQGIACDHARIIGYGIERLRNKITYTDIAFSLMPDLFTLTELQKVYEVILDKELLKANFRRKIANMVLETNKQRKSAGHRPSKLYRFNPNWHVNFG